MRIGTNGYTERTYIIVRITEKNRNQAKMDKMWTGKMLSKAIEYRKTYTQLLGEFSPLSLSTAKPHKGCIAPKNCERNFCEKRWSDLLWFICPLCRVHFWIHSLEIIRSKTLRSFYCPKWEIMNVLRRNLLSAKIHIEGIMTVFLNRCNVCVTLIR